MKKAVTIVACVFAALLAFAVSLVAAVNAWGGLPPSRARLAALPLIGPALKVQPAPAKAEPGAEALEMLPAGREVPFLRFGPQTRLERLAAELEAKKADYEALAQRLERRSRELDAWEAQMTQERDSLRARFNQEKEALAKAREEIQRKDAELQALRVAIGEAEQKNLKATADIYAKMSPEKAAAVFQEMCAGPEMETAVKVLALMDARAAAKVLEALPDAKLSAQLTERLQRVVKGAPQGGGGGG